MALEITITDHGQKDGKNMIHAVINPGGPFLAVTEKWFTELRSAIEWVSKLTLPNEKKGKGKGKRH